MDLTVDLLRNLKWQITRYCLGMSAWIVIVALLFWAAYSEGNFVGRDFFGCLIAAGVVSVAAATLLGLLDPPGSSDRFRAVLSGCLGLLAIAIGVAGVLLVW